MPPSPTEHPVTLPLCFLLFLALLCLSLFDDTATPQAVCSHYASSAGSGSACTESAPCKIGTFLADPAKAAPGAVLCLLDGHYQGEQSVLALTSVSGTEGHPITVRALHDGGALIDGQFQRRPLDCKGSWITVQGVNLVDGNDTVAAIRGEHCTMQRVVAWSTQSTDGIDNIFDVGGSHNLIEDCAAFGYARKMVAVGARGGAGPNTVRRCWAEFNGSQPGSTGGNPTNVFEAGYDQDNVTFENVIATRDMLSSTTEPQPPLALFSTHGSAILGSIAYAAQGQTWDVDLLLRAWPEGGSHVGSGHVTSHALLQDVVLLAGPEQAQMRGFQIQTEGGGQDNRLNRVVSVAPRGGGTCPNGAGWTCAALYSGTTLEQALGSHSVWDVAPGICRRVINRVLTNEPLWPFPIAARVQAARGVARMPQVDLMAQVQARLGTIPAACRSDAVPIPPDPGPTPTPGPHPALACTGTVTAVPGAITMQCVPQPAQR